MYNRVECSVKNLKSAKYDEYIVSRTQTIAARLTKFEIVKLIEWLLFEIVVVQLNKKKKTKELTKIYDT